MGISHDPGNNPLPLDIRELVQYTIQPRKESPRRTSRINFQGRHPLEPTTRTMCCLAIVFLCVLCALLELAKLRFEGFLDVRELLGGSGLNHFVERGSALLALLPEFSILRLVFFRIGERNNPFQSDNFDVFSSRYLQLVTRPSGDELVISGGIPGSIQIMPVFAQLLYRTGKIFRYPAVSVPL